MSLTKKPIISKALEDQFVDLILENTLLLTCLKCLKDIDSMAYLSAGVIRNWIWSRLHDQNYEIEFTEIDVIYFDSDECLDARKNRIFIQLNQKFPNMTWDVTNQALVHQWYRTTDQQRIAPYLSLFDALSSWPETATAIAIRLDQHDKIEIVAPFGLEDLFELKLRWNSKKVPRGVFDQRLQSKKFLEIWSKLQLIE